MRELNFGIAAVVLVTVLTLSCGGGAGQITDPAPEFVLHVQDNTFIDGGTLGKAALETQYTEVGYTVDVSVIDAQNLKALFFELSYDEKLWHPVGCESSGLLDLPANMVEAKYLGDPGVVSHGQVVQNYDQHNGFSGDGVLARVEFAAGAREKPRKTSSLGTQHASGPIVYVDYYNKVLRVYHNISGDYDQNGEVNLADIMPLSLFFGQGSQGNDAGIIGPFEDGTVVDLSNTRPKFYVDGNKDGEINLADISTIASQYGNSYSKIVVCGTDDYAGFYPFGGGMTDSSVVVDTLSTTPAIASSWDDRAYREFELPQIDPTKHYWVHPGSGTEFGDASMVGVDYGGYPPLIDRDFGLEYDAASQMLSFNPNLRGDFDLNGEVGLSDLTPYAVYSDNSGPYSIDEIEWNVDGNRDGELSIHDIFMVASSYTFQGNIAVYATSNPDEVPANRLAPAVLQPIMELSAIHEYDYDNSSKTESLNDWWKGRNGVPLVDRPRIRAVINFDPGTYVWLSMGGPSSEVIQIP